MPAHIIIESWPQVSTPPPQGVCNVSRGESATHVGGDAGIQPASVDVVAHKVWRLDHLHAVVHCGSDLTPDFDLFQRHHHCPDGSFTSVSLGKEVPKLHRKTA